MATLPLFMKKFGVNPNNDDNRVKNAPYECGMETLGSSRPQFKLNYYCFALLFVTLDVMAVFLFPWAVGISGLPGFGDFSGGALIALIGVGVFLLILTIGYVYAWKKRLLEWK